MKDKKIKEVWNEIFGFPTGAKVRLKPELWANFPTMHLPPLGKNEEESIKIPSSKFVGEIIERNDISGYEVYSVKWLADRRKLRKSSCFLWKKEYIQFISF